MTDKKITREKAIEHPLEDILDITPGSTLIEYTETLPAEVTPMANYDAKDDEIEEKLEEIYSLAMDQVQTLGDEIERVEGRHKARMGEVSATMLNVALGAVREKRALKEHKDKVKPVPGGLGPQTVNNTLNVVSADRNELLKLFMDQSEKK